MSFFVFLGTLANQIILAHVYWFSTYMTAPSGMPLLFDVFEKVVMENSVKLTFFWIFIGALCFLRVIIESELR